MLLTLHWLKYLKNKLRNEQHIVIENPKKIESSKIEEAAEDYQIVEFNEFGSTITTYLRNFEENWSSSDKIERNATEI